MKKNKFCLPLHSVSKEYFYTLLENNKSIFYYFEIWLEYLPFLTDAEIEGLACEYKDRIIFNVRKFDFSSVSKRYNEIINKVIQCNCLIDLDFLKQQDLIRGLKKEIIKKNIILSFHDYEKTLNEAELLEVINKISAESPYIIKVSCLTHCSEDAVKLLNIGLKLKSQKLKCIVLGMGEHGVVTRTFGTKWYNEFVYCKLPGTTGSAPGQVTRDEVLLTLDYKE